MSRKALRRRLWVSWCDGFRWAPYQAWLDQAEGRVGWPASEWVDSLLPDAPASMPSQQRGQANLP